MSALLSGLICAAVPLMEAVTYNTFDNRNKSAIANSLHEELPTDIIQEQIWKYCDKPRLDNLVSTNSYLRELYTDYHRAKIKYYFNTLIINEDKVEDILLKYPRDFIEPRHIPQRILGQHKYSATLGISNQTHFGSLQFLLHKFKSKECIGDDYTKQEQIELTIILNRNGIEHAYMNKQLLSNTSRFYDINSISDLLRQHVTDDDNGDKLYFPAIPCIQRLRQFCCSYLAQFVFVSCSYLLGIVIYAFICLCLFYALKLFTTQVVT